MKKFNSISVKLPFILNIVTIIICLFIILSLINLSTKEISNYVNEYVKSSANGYCNFIDKSIEDQILLMESYSSMPIIIDYIQGADWMESSIFLTLKKVLDNNEYITNAYILSKDSSVLTSYNGNDNRSGLKASDVYPDLWNRFVSSNYSVTISDTIYESTINDGYILPMLCPIFDYGNNFIGAFIGFIDWSLIIKDSLEKFGNAFSKDNTIFIINKNKEFVYHNITSELKKQ